MAREEGVLIGGSGGTAVHAAVEVAKQLGQGKIVVTLIPDSGRPYLSSSTTTTTCSSSASSNATYRRRQSRKC